MFCRHFRHIIENGSTLETFGKIRWNRFMCWSHCENIFGNSSCYVDFLKNYYYVYVLNNFWRNIRRNIWRNIQRFGDFLVKYLKIGSLWRLFDFERFTYSLREIAPALEFNLFWNWSTFWRLLFWNLSTFCRHFEKIFGNRSCFVDFSDNCSKKG